jgi:serine/threonine protein kinase
VLHRDLKPHNVMLTRQGQARLMDFGIARVLEEQREGLTNTSSAVGTLAYMPAEMLQGGAVLDARTDVYLAGNLLLELMTFSPFGDAESRGDCPEAWGELIADSMNRLRGKRPASMIVFLDRLLGEPEKRPAEPVRPVAKTLAQELEDLMKWTTEVHEEARRMAEKTQDYAGAARMLEALPEASRDAKLYGEICRRRDQVAELEKEVAEGVRTGRLAGLRPRVEEWLKLQPRRKGELQSLLEQLPKEVELPRELVNSIGMEFRKS